jgi:hypothetical protein
MRTAYRALAYLVSIAVVLQAASIAYAWFSVLNDIDGGAVFDSGSEGNIGHLAHGMLGMIGIPLLALALLIVSFFAKINRGVTWAAIVLGVAVLQVALAFVSFGAPVVGALHGINALVLLGVAEQAARRARPGAAVRIPSARSGSHARTRRGTGADAAV